MKHHKAFQAFIIFLNLFSILKSQKVQKINSTIVSHAIADIIDILGDSHAMRFQIIIANENDQLEVIASKILKKTSSPLSVRYCTDDKRQHHIFKGTPAILLTDGQLISDIRLEDSPISKNNTGLEKRQTNSFVDTAIIIYVYGSSEIFIKSNGIGSIYYQILFSANDQNPILANFMPLTNKSCVPNWQNISEFSSQNLSWNSKVFVRKYEKFHNCPIRIAVFEGFTGGVGDTIFKCIKKKNGHRKFSGIGGEVLNVFISKYEVQVVQHNEGEVYDIATIPFNLRNIPSDGHLTSPITYLYSTFLLTYGHFYDPYEKIILPFDTYIWFALISTFCAAFISIFITYRFSKIIQDYIFGIGVSYPTLGVLQIFFGLGYVHLPHRNFARILFIAFTIFCLVVRTAYQGKMFDFIVGDIRKPMPETIEELLNSGIHIFRGANGSLDVFDM